MVEREESIQHCTELINTMEQKTQDLSEWLAGALDFGCFASVLSRLSAGQSCVLALLGPLGAA